MAKTNNVGKDLTDTPRDLERMEKESAGMDLPDVNDIPGQENTTPAPLGELADTTPASADEEADNLLDDSNDNITNNDATVTDVERDLLERSATVIPNEEEEGVRQAALDNVDLDGEPLNEAGLNNAISGSDLDVPGSEADDEDEAIGEEDEENNAYSLGGDETD